jgi:hypothetical protein
MGCNRGAEWEAAAIVRSGCVCGGPDHPTHDLCCSLPKGCTCVWVPPVPSSPQQSLQTEYDSLTSSLDSQSRQLARSRDGGAASESHSLLVVQLRADMFKLKVGPPTPALHRTLVVVPSASLCPHSLLTHSTHTDPMWYQDEIEQFRSSDVQHGVELIAAQEELDKVGLSAISLGSHTDTISLPRLGPPSPAALWWCLLGYHAARCVLRETWRSVPAPPPWQVCAASCPQQWLRRLACEDTPRRWNRCPLFSLPPATPATHTATTHDWLCRASLPSRHCCS